MTAVRAGRGRGCGITRNRLRQTGHEKKNNLYPALKHIYTLKYGNIARRARSCFIEFFTVIIPIYPTHTLYKQVFEKKTRVLDFVFRIRRNIMYDL